MRSALLSVKGVTRAQVVLEDQEAVVTYDPSRVTVEHLLKAVAEAEGPARPRQYTARVKEKKPAAS